MAIEFHVWVKIGPGAMSWARLLRPILEDLIEVEQIEPSAQFHLRPNKFAGRHAEQLMSMLSTSSDQFRLHIVILDNTDVFYGKLNGEYRLSVCIADKILLANSIARVVGNSRLLIFDLIHPETAPVTNFQAVKEELKYAARIRRSKIEIVDFTRLEFEGLSHCPVTSTRHMCDECSRLTRGAIRDSIETITNFTQVFASED
jgi:hypothetical protein